MKTAEERLAAVALHLEIERAAPLGQGMTCAVYDIGDGRVLKIYFGPQDERYLARLRRFSDRLQHSSLPVAAPHIYEFGAVEGVHFQIERRLPGRELAQVFPGLSAGERQRSLSSYLDALPPLHAIRWPRQPFGEQLYIGEEITADRWPRFLQERISATLAQSYADLQADLPDVDRVLDGFNEALDSLPDQTPKCLVHGDYFFGNVLCDERGILTAIVDFSPLTLVGDPLLDVAAAYYYCGIFNFVTEADYRFLRREIDRRYGPHCWPRLDLYYTFFSLRFSDCKISDNHTYQWCLRRLRELC